MSNFSWFQMSVMSFVVSVAITASAMTELEFFGYKISKIEKETNKEKDEEISNQITSENIAKYISDSTLGGNGVRNVYKSFQSAAFVLRLFQSIHLTQNEHESFYQLLNEIESRINLFKTISNTSKLIVVEGLNGSGKTTLVKDLTIKSSKYKHVELSSIVLNVSEVFQSHDSCYLNAYNYILNYFLMNEILKDIDLHSGTTNYENNPDYYFIDSFYHSTLVTTIMSQIDDVDSKDMSNSVFDWPIDLPVPNMVSVDF